MAGRGGRGAARGPRPAPGPHTHAPRPPPHHRFLAPTTHLPKLLKVAAERLLVHAGRQAAHKNLLGALPRRRRLLVLGHRALLLGQRLLGLHLASVNRVLHADHLRAARGRGHGRQEAGRSANTQPRTGPPPGHFMQPWPERALRALQLSISTPHCPKHTHHPARTHRTPSAPAPRRTLSAMMGSANTTNPKPRGRPVCLS